MGDRQDNATVRLAIVVAVAGAVSAGAAAYQSYMLRDAFEVSANANMHAARISACSRALGSLHSALNTIRLASAFISFDDKLFQTDQRSRMAASYSEKLNSHLRREINSVLIELDLLFPNDIHLTEFDERLGVVLFSIETHLSLMHAWLSSEDGRSAETAEGEYRMIVDGFVQAGLILDPTDLEADFLKLVESFEAIRDMCATRITGG